VSSIVCDRMPDQVIHTHKCISPVAYTSAHDAIFIMQFCFRTSSRCLEAVQRASVILCYKIVKSIGRAYANSL